MGSPDRDQIFICYAHRDAKRFDELQTHLKPLRRHHKAQVKVWSDQDLAPGAEWRPAIKEAIAKAKVAILLVSPEFLASDFIEKKELPPIFAAAENSELTVLWVLLSHCHYSITAIDKYQAAHDVGHPMDGLSKPKRNKTWHEICEHIRKLMLPKGNQGQLAAGKPSAAPKKVVDQGKKEKVEIQKPNHVASTIESISEPNRTTKPKLNDKSIIVLPGGFPLTMLWVSHGDFMMGSQETEKERGEDEAWHPVVLTKGFWLGQTAVTQAQWKAIMGENPSHSKGVGLPVEGVSWTDCQTYIQKLNTVVDGGGFRLPTEAEWEYACRAGTTTPYSFGETITRKQVNFYGVRPFTVASLPANPWGFHEMHGNVWEWCLDRYSPLKLGVQRDPIGIAGGQARVLRGGSWFNDSGGCRSAVRYSVPPEGCSDLFGFRVARDHKASGAGT